MDAFTPVLLQTVKAMKAYIISIHIKMLTLVPGVFVLVHFSVWRPCFSHLDDEDLEPTQQQCELMEELIGG